MVVRQFQPKPKPKAADGEPEMMLVDNMQLDDVQCLWDPYIPRGALTLVSGVGGIGKSTVLQDIIARGSRGSTAPDGLTMMDGVPFGSMLLCGEDPYDKIVAPRLLRMGADGSKIELLPVSPWPCITDTKYLEKLHERALRAKRLLGLGLIVIDGWKDFMIGVNTYDENQVRPAMHQIGAFAMDLDIAVVGIVHPPKHDTKGISGSAAFRNNSRSVLVFEEKPTEEEPMRSMIVHDKHNWTAKGPTLVYAPDRGVIRWIGVIDESTIIDPGEDNDRPGRSDAKAILYRLLKEGPVDLKMVKEIAEHEVISMRTFRKARVDLGARAGMAGYANRKTLWWLPKDEVSAQKQLRKREEG